MQKENERLIKLLKDHFEGNPWIDVQLMESISGLSAVDAVKNIHGLNSIWQLLHHLTCWRETILQRMRLNNIPTPADNFFIEIKDDSEQAWANALVRLKTSQQNILNYLKEKIEWDEIPPSGNFSFYELLQGLLQHDAFHLGQIVLIRKMIGSTVAQ